MAYYFIKIQSQKLTNFKIFTKTWPQDFLKFCRTWSQFVKKWKARILFIESILVPIKAWSTIKKKVVNIAIWKLGPVSNERSGNITFYRGIHEFSNSPIFEKVTVFLILCCSFNFTENSVNWKYSREIKTVIFSKSDWT